MAQSLQGFAPRARGVGQPPPRWGFSHGYTLGMDMDEEHVGEAQAAEDEAWLAGLPPQRRALVMMMLDRLCDAERDSTWRPFGAVG